MSVYNFTDPATSRVYRIDGPAGLTEAQARQIWQQQLTAGALTGLRRGESIDAYTQALGGLSTAESQVAQAEAGIPGSVVGRLTGAFNQSTQSASTLSPQLSPQRSVTSQTLEGVTRAIRNTPVTDPITFADYAKQAPALRTIQGLNQPEVTAAISQASRLTGQSASQISDTQGLGKYGLSVDQLERAGVIKPGTAATYLNQSQNTVTSVLNSPAVWTGKNGINNVDDLLDSASKQDLIQQDLMSSGLSAVQQLGIPTDLLSSQSLAGVALNAAKSIEGTVNWAKGQLSGTAKTAFDILAKDAAFAVNLADTKLNAAMKQEIPGFPAVDTVDRATLNAAAARITGNDKIPEVRWTTEPAVPTAAALSLSLGANSDRFREISIEFEALSKKTDEQRQTTNSYFSDLREYEGLVDDLSGIEGELVAIKRRAEKSEPPNPGSVAQADQAIAQVAQLIASIESAMAALQQQIEARRA
jgi:hypothetical protein